MSERHHIFNFHMGFWGSLLVSMLVMIQSALLMLMTSGVGFAQQDFLTITLPPGDVQVITGTPLALEAIILQPAIIPVSFSITNAATGLAENIIGNSADGLTFNAQWIAGSPGMYEVRAEVVDPQQIIHRAGPIMIESLADINVIVDMVGPPAGSVITDVTPLVAVTDVGVDGLQFLFTPVTVGDSDIFSAQAADPAGMNWSFDFDPFGITPADYFIQPRALIGGQLFDGPRIQVTVQPPAAAESITLTFPQPGQTLKGIVDFTAATFASATELTFQITNVQNSVLATVNALDQCKGVNWSAQFDTSTIPNNTDLVAPYSFVAFATINNQVVLGDNISILVDNPALATVIWGGVPAEDIWGNLLSANEFAALSYKMYPNPVKNDFVYFSSTQDLDIIIYDVLGKQVVIENITPNKDFINISNLNKGIYLVKIISNHGAVTKKLIVQ